MNAILSILKDHKESLFTSFPIKSLALFGSYSRGDFKNNSDVDIMVELTESKALAFIDLSYHLEKILKKKVDLVSKNGVRDDYFNYLKKDLKYV